jgi:hypothetical protein
LGKSIIEPNRLVVVVDGLIQIDFVEAGVAALDPCHDPTRVEHDRFVESLVFSSKMIGQTGSLPGFLRRPHLGK